MAAVAPAMPVVLAARLIQGLGGGLMLALSTIVIQQSFDDHLWGRLYGVVAMVWSAGSLLGPLLGGVFAHYGAWRFAFGAFALQAIAVAFVSHTRLEPVPSRRSVAERWPFMPLILIAAATWTIAEAGLADITLLAVFECGVGLVLLWIAAVIDRRSEPRLLPMETLNMRHPVGQGLLAVMALAAGSTGFWAYGALVLKALFGTEPLISGYILAGEALAWTMGTMAVSGLPRTAGRSLIRVGAVLILAGGAGFAVSVPSGSFASIVLCSLVQGVGFGICWPAIMQQLVRVSAPEEATLAAAAPGTVQRVGYGIGAAATGIAANASGLIDGITPEAAAAAGFWVFAGFVPILALGVLGAWGFTRARD
jgi:MFS family permease